MPWRFIIFLLICILFAVFVAVNLDNKADISFIVASVSQVPVFLVVLFSFAVGSGSAILAMFFSKSKRRKIVKEKNAKKKRKEEEPDAEITRVAEPRQSRRKKR